MSDDDPDELVRIGDLAAAAGSTVRALHHYEHVGLLASSARTEGGHRLYDATAVARLYEVLRLRRLGLPLDRIGRVLDDPGTELADVLRDHAAVLDDEISRAIALRDVISGALAAVTDGGSTTITTTRLMEVLTAMESADSLLRQRISILVYRDIEAAHRHLVDVFGMTPGELSRAPDGTVVHGEVYGGDGVIWLHPESDRFGLASPATVGRATATMAMMVDDVDAHHEAVAEHGGDIVYGPVDQPYGYREYGARDPEGTLWSFMRPIDG